MASFVGGFCGTSVIVLLTFPQISPDFRNRGKSKWCAKRSCVLASGGTVLTVLIACCCLV